MIDYDTYSISPDPVYGSNVNFDEEGNPILVKSDGYELTAEDEICFNCRLPECVEEAKKGCVIELIVGRRKIVNWEKKESDGTITASDAKKLTTLRKNVTLGEQALVDALNKGK